MTTTRRLFSALLTTLIILSPVTRLGAEGTPPPAAAAASAETISTEFKQVFEKIIAKLKDGKKSEPDLAAEIAAIDALLAKHAAEKTDEVAMVAMMKARLYLEVLENTDKAIALFKEISVNFPQTEVAKKAAQMVTIVEQQTAADRMLALGQPFPAFAEKDLNGAPLSPANHKGKIVLVDFWATWCGPCVGELPNVVAAYEKFHAKGFEVIGISLDESRDALTGFIKENKMPWAQYFDGLGWNSKLATQFGIHSIPATFLLDREGKIIARNLRGDDLANKLAELLK